MHFDHSDGAGQRAGGGGNGVRAGVPHEVVDVELERVKPLAHDLQRINWMKHSAHITKRVGPQLVATEAQAALLHTPKQTHLVMIARGVWQLLVVEDVVARQPVALLIEFYLAVGQVWNRVKCISRI